MTGVATGHGRQVYASSSYGHIEDEPLEACESEMGAVHAFGEMALQAFHGINHLDATVVRTPTRVPPCSRIAFRSRLASFGLAAPFLRSVRPGMFVRCANMCPVTPDGRLDDKHAVSSVERRDQGASPHDGLYPCGGRGRVFQARN